MPLAPALQQSHAVAKNRRVEALAKAAQLNVIPQVTNPACVSKAQARTIELQLSLRDKLLEQYVTLTGRKGAEARVLL